MAKYIPDGWRMSADGARRYKAEIGRIEGIVRKRVAKYSLQAQATEDLLQEGRFAAAYAVDTYSESRGSLNGYIGVVVANALAMVAAESLAQQRQTYTDVQQPDGTWKKIPVRTSELFEDAHTDIAPTPIQRLARRDDQQERQMEVVDLDAELAARGFGDDARELIKLRLNPPPELWIEARNRNAGRYTLNAATLAEHLGWAKSRLTRASQEVNQLLNGAPAPKRVVQRTAPPPTRIPMRQWTLPMQVAA